VVAVLETTTVELQGRCASLKSAAVAAEQVNAGSLGNATRKVMPAALRPSFIGSCALCASCAPPHRCPRELRP
jgi:hypothetical protein